VTLFWYVDPITWSFNRKILKDFVESLIGSSCCKEPDKSMVPDLSRIAVGNNMQFFDSFDTWLVMYGAFCWGHILAHLS
jgi:hypothetical protein